MRIALVVHDLHESGGHSLYTQVLANALSLHHEVAVFANRCEHPRDARWKSVHVRAWRRSALACVQTFPVGLRSHASNLDTYDIHHSQGFCGGAPNVVTAHICVSAYLESLRSISVRNRASLNLMAMAEERFYRNYEGTVIAVSRKVAHELQRLYQVKSRINVIPHGVESVRFNAFNRGCNRPAARLALEFGEKQTVALYVGDLTKAHVHLKALSQASPLVQFIIISRSKQYHWQAQNVRFLPATDSIEQYYMAADAFVFPSTYDAFGMVVLEAMAAGLPVFCSDQAGASELIDSGKNGFVFTLNEFVLETSTHLGNLSLLKEVGAAAQDAAQQHDWSFVTRKVEDVYEEVLRARA